MVTTDKSWTSTLNVSLGSSPFSMTGQYQQLLISLKDQFILAGWTVQRCSNGTTAGATDLWGSTLANVVHGTTGARSWIALGAPSGYANGSAYSILIEAYSTAAPTNPTTYRIYTSSTAFTGGTTTAIPTGGTGATTARTYNTSYNTGTDTPVQAYVNFWRTTAGDVLWINKQVSTMTYARFGGVFDADNARSTANRLLLLEDSTDPFHVPSVYGYATDNSVVFGATALSRASTVTSWPNGQDSTANVGYFPLFAMNNGTSSLVARDYGILPDIWGVSSNTPDNATDATDTDPMRLLTIGGIALPTTFSQTPIL